MTNYTLSLPAVLSLILPLLFTAWLHPSEGLAILPALLGIGGLVSQFLGGAAKGAADGREKQADLQSRQDQIKTAQYGIGQNAQFDLAQTDLARKNFEENSRGGRAKQALLGALLSNLQDVNISVPGIQTAQISGGLRPSALGEGGRAAGALLNQQALMKMLQGDQFQGGNILQAPGVQVIPKPSTWEKIAGIGGLIGGGMGLAGQAMGAFKGAPSTAGVPMEGGGLLGSGGYGGGDMGDLSSTSAPAAASLPDIISYIQNLTRSDTKARQ